MAIALLYGGVESKHFDEEYLRDPKVLGLAAKVKVAISEEADPVAEALLFAADHAAHLDAVIRPALAQSWTVSDNGTRVTFTLRDGLQFSDGTPLRASDVVHSWRRLFRAGGPSPLASLIADGVHVHPRVLRLAWQALGDDRVILVTDAVA